MMDNKFKDYYKILGVTPRSSFENIRGAAEHELSQNWNNAMGRLEIQEAYEILSDPEKRKEYDEEFNKRLSEREMAIRNARTFEEYIAATSLHSELANVEIAPEVEVPQEEIEEIENNILNTESISETVGEEQGEATINSTTSDVSETSSEETGLLQESGEEVEEIEEIQEQIPEEEQENEEIQEQIPEEEQENEEIQKQIPEEEQEVQVSDQEEIQEQEFINIPIKRIEKEIEQQQLNEPIKANKEVKEEDPIISKAAVKELIRAALIAGGVGLGVLTIGTSVIGVSLGLMAGVAVGDFYKKHADKIKIQRKPDFQKESKLLEIKEVETKETQFLNEYAENLENQIYDLLDKPSKNYELEIAIRKYENLIELTKKRINFKVSEALNDCTIFKKMEIKSLKDKLNRLNKTLKLLNEKKAMQTEKKDPRLFRINQQLSNTSHEILKIQNGQVKDDVSKEDVIDDLMLKRASLLEKRDAKANRMYVNKNFISFGQVTLVKLNSAKNIVKSTVNKFIDLNQEEQMEESGVKSI